MITLSLCFLHLGTMFTMQASWNMKRLVLSATSVSAGLSRFTGHTSRNFFLPARTLNFSSELNTSVLSSCWKFRQSPTFFWSFRQSWMIPT